MIRRFFNQINQYIISLRSSMLFIFISLFVATTSLIIIVTTIRYTKTTTYVAHKRMESASTSVLRQINAILTPTSVSGQFSAHLIQNGVVKNGEEQIQDLTIELINSLPFVFSSFWGDEHGNFIYSNKANNGGITSEIYNRNHLPATHTIIHRDSSGKIIEKISSPDLSFDPRVRPWYTLAKKEKQTIWTDIYFYQHLHDRGVTTASPVFKDGQFYGAVAISINLNYLSKIIKNQRVTANGYAFIITKEGKLIAYPDKKVFTDLLASPQQLDELYAHSIPLIENSLEQYKKRGKKKLTFSYSDNNDTYIINYTPVKAFEDYGWLIGVVVPQSDFTAELKKLNIITLYISLIILVLGILLISRLVNHIIRPLKLLVKETENIKHFNLEEDIQIISHIKEIIHLRDSIHSMKIGLKLFQRYIPKILVKQLIESGEDVRIGGVRKNLTVFFSDIAHFTTFAEKTEPNMLMVQMGEYFEELTQIIISEKGTIDKYIGDAIMAFWGAPLPNMNPCHHAARAALRCQKRLDELNAIWQQKGYAVFFTRIGIHMGDAIVGNLGSSERINYTAIGDTINTASRLESINKNYKTKIIVSEAVYEQIKDQFVLRRIDCVVVKGRSQRSAIYELLTDNIECLEFDLSAYTPPFENGFAAYRQQSWDVAISYFMQCLEIYPTDTIAPIFIARCQRFKRKPPKPGWEGIME
ncbi:adenylate/guanylate cyclase domain-containing protein [Legionella fallonii]|uniref:Putative adenylate cyclase 1 n=1 Tax=Legionella fallonii LLAP-10 TaxID=1212491 RepID=A0A098G836_9GAMM|nr:adenylate/guanylate cyclase domain-containing protein [Legionella fallonii]CEG58642.1 putative adenylate cyclase 1 [Legionella fallonii LLAP-10]